MGHIELYLVPTPGSKPEFLAAVELINNDNPPHIWKYLLKQTNKIIVLEGYTRDPWHDTGTTRWTKLQVKSIDGRKKLPGFINYLRERQKSCFGRFTGTSSTDETTKTTFVWVISSKQTNSSVLSCRVAPISAIADCPLRPKSSVSVATTVPVRPITTSTSTSQSAAAIATASSKTKKRGFGLLGNLVAGQKRTNHQVISAVSSKNPDGRNDLKKDVVYGDQEIEQQQQHQQELKSSGKVLADFRHEMEQKFLDFDINSEETMKVHVKLSDHSRKVIEADKGKVSIEILKYIVFEQAEEVNEEWIAHKEPGEFSDEITIAVYKDADNAPPEVLEELNQAEIPEEMKAQQKMVQEKIRKHEANEVRIQEALQRQALRNMVATGTGENSGELQVLNKQKRDLRTIEEIQKDSNLKRRKIE